MPLTHWTVELDADDLRDIQEAMAACQKRGYLPKGIPDASGETSELRGLLLGEVCRHYVECMSLHDAEGNR